MWTPIGAEPSYPVALRVATHYHAGMRWLLMALVRFYRRFISPLTPPSCRFYPTCSSFALEALQTHNALTGTCLMVRRVCSCHPWHPGGVDPVPPPSAVTLLGGRKTVDPVDP